MRRERDSREDVDDDESEQMRREEAAAIGHAPRLNRVRLRESYGKTKAKRRRR